MGGPASFCQSLGGAARMPINLTPEEFYRREADRLRSMADSLIFYDVRDGLLQMAQEYDVLAGQREGLRRHSFGRPLERTAGGADGDRDVDTRQDHGAAARRTG